MSILMRNEFDITNDLQVIELIEEIKEILKDFGFTISEKYRDNERITYNIHKIIN